tara:strand:+ start:252 stop:497 length:246 start_codon:yes stop_codon:yes gene_type:complete
MSIQTGIILKTLSQSSRVEIVFESLTSNKTHKGTYTLRNKGMVKNQSNDSDTIVAWDVENKKWQDIRVSTITQFMGIPDGK